MGQVVTVDCRGMQCPAPILRVAKTAKDAKGQPLIMEVLADDNDFPNDLEAWCRTSRATVHELKVEDSGIHRAVVGLNGALRPAQTQADVPATAVVPAPAPAPAPALSLVPPTPTGQPNITSVDLRGLRAPDPIWRLSAFVGSHAGQSLSLISDDPRFMTDVVPWASATGTVIEEIRADTDGTAVRLRFPGRAGASTDAVAVVAPASTGSSMVPMAAPSQALALRADDATDAVPRLNQATLLVLRNDFESLMAALLVATTSAAQGMDVVIFFSFWGVNVLRGDKLRKTDEGRVSIIQRMMKWMMPKGPSRQKLSKMNMAGMGKGMMEMLMRKNNVMTISELLDTAAEQNVKFVVCTMSMGIMGIQKRDLVDLPNMDYAGVTLFVEQSRQSAFSMVF